MAMAHNGTPLSQSSNPLGPVWSSFDSMDDDAKSLADDLIDLLGRVNKTHQIVDADTKAEAVTRFDEAERARVQSHNLGWVVYWARGRLLRWTAHSRPPKLGYGAGGGSSMVVGGDGIVLEQALREDHGVLWTLRGCRDVLDDLRKLAEEVDAVVASRDCCGEMRI
ncbi:hypothetical protein B0T26DRAFT_677109 [Lasiosphaeria miniovina]|uniref:Uncharacterized protein n=1 Tax=Lasiosphaeria miniovina TaxID=1954250 RepID=A0AA40AB83_9PEZI|nr:uncharacterized protein B0T26DRAFT_677109 [Lasiosphaeria miniovina]KAK0712679.1 hypothetical protein B0T26DRAFT_677109 [Lasiosphaeria miniovina]